MRHGLIIARATTASALLSDAGIETPFLAWIFNTLERRVRARGLQERMCVLVGRVPSRGAIATHSSRATAAKPANLSPQAKPAGA